MMTKAQERLTKSEESSSSSISWIIHDLNSEEHLAIPDSSADAIISTLVIEHIVSLGRFFQQIFRLLKKNESSWVFMTAMHPNMYRAGSQAGFIVNQITGEKLCGTSFDHSIEEIIDAARRTNLILVNYIEKGVKTDEDIDQFGSRAKKWQGVNIHASFLFKLIE